MGLADTHQGLFLNMKNRFAIIGGTGTTGIKIAELLLKYTDATVTIAARNRERINESVKLLSEEYQTDKIFGAVADANDKESLKKLFADIDMVIVASGTAELVEVVAQAALDSNVDYLDIQYSAHKIKKLKAFETEIEDRGKLFITDAGFHPGLPATLIKYSEYKWGNIRSAIVYSVLKQDWRGLDIRMETKIEFVKELVDYDPYFYSKGKWKKASMLSTKDFKEVDFGEHIGEQNCIPMNFEELKIVAEQLPNLEETGFYIAGFNRFIDMVLLPFIMVWMKMFNKFGIKSIARLMFRSLKKNSKPPFRTILQMEARNTDNEKFGLRLSHEDGYWFTAIPVAACLKQYMNGALPDSGLYCMGNIVEPQQIIADMKMMGITIEEL